MKDKIPMIISMNTEKARQNITPIYDKNSQ